MRGDELHLNDLLTVACCRPEHGSLSVQVRGELDLSNAFSLRNLLCRLAPSVTRMTLELEELTFCDSSGLGALVEIAAACREHGTSLVLAHVGPVLRCVLEATMLIDAFELTDESAACTVSGAGEVSAGRPTPDA
jgi:anti-sigma B factor antagonist